MKSRATADSSATESSYKVIAVYGSGLSAWSHKPRIAGSNPASATNKTMPGIVVSLSKQENGAQIAGL